MGKQRSQRRVQRQVLQQQETRAAREAKEAKSRQRRAERRATQAERGRGRTGWTGLRRSRRQRVGIAVVAGGGIALMWVLVVLGVLDVGLAIALSVLLLVALPAFVVLALGRRY